MTVKRVGVSFEPELLERFDALIGSKGYRNRSEAIRDLVRESIVRSDSGSDSGDMIGTLTIIYDHDIGDVTNRLLHLQHHHLTEIVTTTHIHIDEKNCLEVMIVRGRSENVRRMADTIKSIKGVKHGDLFLTRTSFKFE